MIKRIKNRSQVFAGGAEWPVNPREALIVFAMRPPLRKLKVLVDAALIDVPPAGAGLDKPTLLRALLNTDMIEWYRYTDGLPPADIVPIDFSPHPSPANPVYAGWVVAYPADGVPGPARVMYSRNPPNGFTAAGVRGNMVDVARTDRSQPVYQDLDPVQQDERRAADMLALLVANQALHADLFITERPYLHSQSNLVTRTDTTVCTLAEAIPPLALYLRAQREFVIPTGDEPEFTYRFGRGLYFWVGARELLPAAWRWFGACNQHSNGSGDGKLVRLGGSLLNRVTRALQERDAVYIALHQPTDPDATDEALGSLDSVLVLLMGAMDAAARVAHYVLNLTGSERTAGWQSDDWRKKVAAKAPALAALVDAGTPGEHTLTILRLLRNSVHGAALEGVQYIREGNAETRVGLPPDDEAQILAAMDAMGGRASWGVQSLGAGLTHVEPAVLVDGLFVAVVSLLNNLMGETPMETLPHVTITAADRTPPNDDTFSEWKRLAIRWQLGF